MKIQLAFYHLGLSAHSPACGHSRVYYTQTIYEDIHRMKCSNKEAQENRAKRESLPSSFPYESGMYPPRPFCCVFMYVQIYGEMYPWICLSIHLGSYCTYKFYTLLSSPTMSDNLPVRAPSWHTYFTLPPCRWLCVCVYHVSPFFSSFHYCKVFRLWH